MLYEVFVQMKRFIALAGLLTSSLVLSSVAQAPPSSAAPAKVAVIAFQDAMLQTNEAQRSMGDLQKKFEPKREQLKARSAELDALAKQLQTDSATLSDAERASRTKTIGEKKRVFDRDAKDAQNDLQTEMQGIYKTLGPKVYEVLVGYAKQQGYTLVLDTSPEQNPVLYAGDSTNITKDIIDAYNLKSGVPAALAPRPATGSAPARPAPKAPTAH
jgi:outer membrane protein